MKNDDNRTAAQIFNEMAETMQRCHPDNISMEEARMLTRDFIAFCNLCVKIQTRMEKERKEKEQQGQPTLQQKPAEQKLAEAEIINN